MYRPQTHIAILTLAAITILWISGTLGQDPAAVLPDPISSGESVPTSGSASGIGYFPSRETSRSDASGDAVAAEPAPAPAPIIYEEAASSSTPVPTGGASSSSSISSSSGYSSASITSDGQTGSVFTYLFPAGAEPDPLREADQRFVQSTRELIAKYQRITDSGEREMLRDQLNDVLVKHFEVRQQMRVRELEELEAQVERLRELHDRREQEKVQIVRDHLQQLLRDAEGLGWGASGGGTGSAVRIGGSGSGATISPSRPRRVRP
jgi:hypothetical protein